MRKIIAMFLLIALFGISTVHSEQGIESVSDSIVRIQATIPEEANTAQSLGTTRVGNGVVIDEWGHVLTIGYLIIEAEHIEVTGFDGITGEASFVGYDFDTGFGLLRFDQARGAKPMKLGRSSEVREGNLLHIARYGGPEAVQPTRVISTAEFVGYWEYRLEHSLYVSPPVRDFGGAALIGGDGELLGIGSILTRITVPEFGTIPSNMFVPIDLLKPILNDLIHSGRPQTPPRPWLGLLLQETQGIVFIIGVSRGGPAEKVGLQPGDAILAVESEKVSGLANFYRQLWDLGEAGAAVRLTIRRGARVQEIIVKSANRYEYLNLRPGTGTIAIHKGE
jgi:S1-C subfamily serine protease